MESNITNISPEHFIRLFVYWNGVFGASILLSACVFVFFQKVNKFIYKHTIDNTNCK